VIVDWTFMCRIPFFILVLSLVSSVWAGIDEGLAAYERKDYAQALTEFRQAAVEGSTPSQNYLGVMYKHGEGVAQDYKQAMAWFRKAAEKSDSWAQHNLGVMYARGEGVAQDYKQAKVWYRKAAEQGHAWSQNNLGVIYADGQAVAQDYKEAVAWFRKAAEQGLATAQANLGLRYENGQGVAQDYKQAVVWYRKAADQGDAKAQNNLAVMYEYSQGVPRSHVIAYALYNLSYGNDPSTNNKAGNNRNTLADEMTTKELVAGQALTARLAQPGMFIKALDAAEKSLGKTIAAPTTKPEPKAQAPVASKPLPIAKNGNCRPKTNQLRCSSQCYNGDCEVTYENGCKVRVQVNAKFDPFTSQWTYPSPSC
jgi:alpha/beta superfamily hydrolase